MSLRDHKTVFCLSYGDPVYHDICTNGDSSFGDLERGIDEDIDRLPTGSC